ncbi:MAG: CHRD domain-containing protein [Acidobacteriota bacterium]
MKKILGAFLVAFLLAGSTVVLADTPDTSVFYARMTGANETPAPIPGSASAIAKITVFVTRDGTGNIVSGTVDLDLVYSFPSPVTLIGLHIHNGPVGVTGGVVIGLGPFGGTLTEGRLTRRAEVTSANTVALTSLNGLLKAPHLYYINLHTPPFPIGAIRGKLLPTEFTFRTKLTTGAEVPPVTGLAASGVAAITLRAERDNAGNIVGGNVDFDVAYNFPGAVSITSLNIAEAGAGATGSTRIDTRIGGVQGAVVDNDGSGNLFRRVEVTTADPTQIAAMNGIFENPAAYYVNLYTAVNPGGAVRGQLSRDIFAFRTELLPTNEAPPSGVAARGVATLTLTVARDGRGNVTSGTAQFDVDYVFPTGVTLTGYHIHNGPEGVSVNPILDSGLSRTTDSDGTGSISLPAVTVDTAVGVAVLNGILLNPSLYYINLHTSDNPGGAIRGQLENETHVFRPTLRPENEIPANTVNASGASLISFRITKGATGQITGGVVDFAVNYSFPGAVTINGLHIHRGTASENGPILIGTAISGAIPVVDSDGVGNIFERVEILPTDGAAAGFLREVLANPTGYYVHLHTSDNPGGVIRNQLATQMLEFAQSGGGADFVSLITLNNMSTTRSVSGVAYFFNQTGGPQTVAVNDAVVPFSIPPSGTRVFSNNPKGVSASGYARIFTDSGQFLGFGGGVDESVTYSYPGLTSAFARSQQRGKFSAPVSFVGNRQPAVAVVNTRSVKTRVSFSLIGANGLSNAVAFVDLAPGEQRSVFLREIFTGSGSTIFGGGTTFNPDGFVGQVRVASIGDGFVQANGIFGLVLEFTPTGIRWLPTAIIP